MNSILPDLIRAELYDEGIPYALMARLRAESPVCWIDEPAYPGFPGGSGYWAVMRHADIQTVSRNPEVFSSWLGTVERRDPRPKDIEFHRQMMLHKDPPEHSKMRRIVAKAFTPQVINQLRGSIEQHAREVVDAVAEKGSVDFVKEIAAELPLLIIAEILGVPAEDRKLLYKWTNALIGLDDPDYAGEPGTFKATLGELFAYCSVKTKEKRAQPTGDVWSLIVNAEVDGERLSGMELNQFYILLVIAGNETTRALIANGMYELSRHPDQRQKLQADLSLLPAAIEEMLRYAPPIVCFRRTATRDTVLGGQSIKGGDKVIVFYPSANRDEAVFTNPDRFDIARNPNPHMAFGDGTHFCLGSNLARLEARVMFTELFTRLPDIEVAGPAVRMRSSFASGLKSMPVQFKPAARLGSTAFHKAPDTAPHDPGRPVATSSPAPSGAAQGAKHATPMLVLFGSNFGTAEDMARHVASEADSYGFSATVAALDEYVDRLPTEGIVIVVCATYNGAPPDNAAKFLNWLDRSEPLSGVNYSVFGCGNREWAATFQDVPRRIDQKLEQRGAKRIHMRGEGDANGDFDGQFQSWRKPLWATLARELSIELEAPAVQGPMFSLEIVPGERMSPFVNSLGARPMRVIVNRELRSNSGAAALDRSTRHIELELPEGVAYRAGDHLGVIPHNSDALVRRVARRFGFEQDIFIRLHARSDGRTFLPIGERISLYTLLADYPELQDIASRANIQILAAHVECPFAKPRLEALANETDGGKLYRDEVLAKRKSVIDILEEHRAIQLPLEIYLEMLSPLSPRYYSISSSPLAAKGRCSITVGVVNAPARSGSGAFAGVCSNYLQHRAQDGVLYAFVKDTKSTFQLPRNPATPIIMIGPGTGVAPFRGFLQERAGLNAAGIAVGPAMLFFGCRHENEDFIYSDELKEFAASGLAELHVAFSRMQEKKIYVQDRLRENSDRVCQLIEDGAIIYVCGDAGRMEPDVRKALVGMIGEKLGVDSSVAAKRFDQLVAEDRYLVDVWATG